MNEELTNMVNRIKNNPIKKFGRLSFAYVRITVLFDYIKVINDNGEQLITPASKQAIATGQEPSIQLYDYLILEICSFYDYIKQIIKKNPEMNFTTDAAQSLTVGLISNQSVDSYVDTFVYKGVSIKDYIRIPTNYTTNVVLFRVVNNWYPGTMNWTISEPAIVNSSYLGSNESLMVLIENNYTAQGNRMPQINATISTFTDRIMDFFEVRPIKVSSLLTLAESLNNSVSELVIKNNLNATQPATWTFNTGVENIVNQTTLNASESVLVYIASNYSTSGIYKSQVFVNSTLYNDTEYGVVVI